MMLAIYALIALLLTLVPAAAAPVTLWIAPDGNDAAPGTAAEPLATLEGARDAVRRLKQAGPLPDGGVEIVLRPGLYEMPWTLVLDAQDAGTPEAPVVYRGGGPEKPVVVGGRTVGGWQRDRGQVLKTDLRAQGLEGVYFRQLLCNGRRMPLARYPNYDPTNPVTGGWAYADGEPVPMYADIPGETRNTLRYREADSRQWARPEEGEVFVFPRYNWWNNIIGIAGLDRESRVITLQSDASYPIRPGDRYFVQNLAEELDAPGEWYLDREAWALYFWPPTDADPASMVVYVPTMPTITEMREGVAEVTFRGIVFECCERTAITLTNTESCRVAGCVIRNVGDYGGSGVGISGGSGNGVVGCDIHDVGAHGISLNGGDRETLEPGENYADNNYLHHTGVYYKQGVGVSLSGVGNRASHNLIHDCPRFGIVWGGNDHIIEFNEIRHCNLETADCGAIYCWQVDWTKRGTEIRYNYLHDIVGFGWENGKWTSPHFNWGIYLDDGTCGTHVHGNIVARTILGGAHVHGGRDNVIENNIFVDGRDSQMQYSGYVKGGHPVPMMTESWNKFHGTEAYLKYPGYKELTESLEDAWQMAGNKFQRNIVAYREPGARLYAQYNLPFDKTESDYNLVWHDGGPIRTGVTAVKELTGPNLALNPGFEEGAPGEVPPGWRWQVRPGESWAGVDGDVQYAGERSLRIEGRGTTTDSSGQRLCPNFVSEEIALEPGQTYRLSASVRAEQATPVSLMPQAYEAGKYFWSRPSGVAAGPEWQRVESTFRFPTPGDPDWRDGMTTIVIRIDIPEGTGTVWVDDVELREAVAMSEWEAWQALGLDHHSVIADPLFVDRDHDNYRLQPDSPALALGFEPIPVDAIGPYEDDLRASWPVVEAVGAREQMTLDWSRH